MFALLVLGLLLWAAPAAQAENTGNAPGPVTNLSPNPGNQSITLTWGPPTDSGSSAVTYYTVDCTYSGYPAWDTVPVWAAHTSYTFTSCGLHNSLINGTQYQFRVMAGNSCCGVGEHAQAAQVYMSAGVPDAPTLTATVGDHQVTLNWTAGDNNGATVTEWEYRQNEGSWTDIANSDANTTTHTVTGLTNGTEHTFGVRAVNGHGGGAIGTIKAKPVGPPEKPTGLTTSDDDQQVTLSWTAPSNNGGSAITGWKYSKDNGTTYTATGATSTTHTVTGLTNGTEYTFKVLAVNTHGDGAESDAATATPATTPAAPTGLSATDGNRQVTLSWTAPTSTGGANITGYKYSKDNGATYTATGATTTSYTVTGLTNGTGYTFKVRAVNRQGDGAESTAATATPATTPAAPTGLTATPDSQTARQMRLSWTAPTNTGGANITRYEYSKDNGSNWTSTGATTTSYTVTTGLTNGTGYPFKVRAVNRKGAGTPSAAATATTTTTPAAPTGLSATDDNQAAGAVALSWTAPTSTGGLAITGYKYSTNNGSSWTATGSTNTSKTVTNLTNGTAYTFKVRAVNNAGDGTASAAVTATPSTTPAKPTLTVVTSNEQVRLEGNSGGTGGAPITRWEYRQKDTGAYGAWMSIQNSNTNTLSALVTGLENGTAYTFQVQAVNKKGSGADSDEVTVTPRDFTATAGNQSVTLNWNALPANANITKWQYRSGSSGNWTDIQNSATSTRSSTVTGLENGTAYTFQVRGLDSGNNPVEQIEFLPATPQPVSGVQTGGGVVGTTPSEDQHGDTAAEATSVGVDSSMPGEMNSSTDQDYFTIDVPQAGLLVVETIGSVDTRGRLMTPDGQMLAQADSGGTRQNFQLTQRVTAGDYLVVVTGRGTGSYRLEVDLLVGFVDNPQPDSAQSGIGVLSGWVCEAETVEFELDGELQQAAYGTERTDTADHCGDTNNGFGLLYNWNKLGDGDHTVRVLVDGIEFASLPVTVTTLGLGDEFPTGLTGEATLVDFPADGESVRLVWQEAQQNFALAEGASTRQGSARNPVRAFLENPAPGSYQSGIRVLSGWVCEAEEVVLEIDGEHRLVASYGTERTDTEDKCGDTDNGFGLLWNWNKLADGSHTVRLLVDGEEWATATFTVTTLGAEMRWGLAYTGTVADFPTPGQAVTVEWQEAQQNFVITGVE